MTKLTTLFSFCPSDTSEMRGRESISSILSCVAQTFRHCNRQRPGKDAALCQKNGEQHSAPQLELWRGVSELALRWGSYRRIK